MIQINPNIQINLPIQDTRKCDFYIQLFQNNDHFKTDL